MHRCWCVRVCMIRSYACMHVKNKQKTRYILDSVCFVQHDVFLFYLVLFLVFIRYCYWFLFYFSVLHLRLPIRPKSVLFLFSFAFFSLHFGWRLVVYVSHDSHAHSAVLLRATAAVVVFALCLSRPLHMLAIVLFIRSVFFWSIFIYGSIKTHIRSFVRLLATMLNAYR